MTERIVRPIRAWAEYDEWSVFMDRTENDDVFRYDRWFIPKGAESQLLRTVGVIPSIVAGVTLSGRGDPLAIGPLRSLRVLYENGYELTLDNERDSQWYWQMPKALASGHFYEDTDSEAVERALIAAAAWFTQREISQVPETVDTD